ncbi:MAG: LysM peptidoglycan-binding domain-containing M23 family metallopeptidase [Acidobacteriota bacterium]
MRIPSRRGRPALLLLGAAWLAACAPPHLPPEAPPPSAEEPGPEETGGAGAGEPEQPPPGVFHQVLRGQTLFTIARTYGVPMGAIVEANGIADPDRIETGALLFVPGAPEVLDVPITVGPGVPGPPLVVPVAGPINSRFGPRHGRMHYGLDIGAPSGTPVRAARDGTVLYAGNGYRGYGRLVILDHGDGYRTLYAHNRRLRARAGQKVRAGEVIAEVGASGNATGPHLHFEVRLDDRPVDPLLYVMPEP